MDGQYRVVRWRPWAWLVLYVGLVYASLPFTPRVAEMFNTTASGRMVLTLGPFVAVVLLVPLAVWLGYGRGRRPRIAPWIVVLGLYAFVWGVLCEHPIEAVHVPQYGLMSVLIMRALRLSVSPGVAYGGSVLLTTAVSFGNELMQGLLPNRVYDLRDVSMDGISGVMGLLVVWQLERS